MENHHIFNGKINSAKMLLLGMLHRREASSLAAPTERPLEKCFRVHWKMMFENQVIMNEVPSGKLT